jgi:hypothetical protein
LTYPPEVVERINTILLGFIQAHDGHRQSDEDVEARLYLARDALFNIPAPSGNRFIDDWDTLLKIAGQYITDRGEPQISNDWELYWDPEPSNVRTFRALARLYAKDDITEQELNTLAKRLGRNFKINRAELLRQAHYSREAFIRADDAIAEPLADWLEKFGIRMEKPRSIKLGHKP